MTNFHTLANDDLESINDESDNVSEINLKVDPKQSPIRIDRYISLKIASLSRNKIQKGIEANCVTVNGQSVKSNYKVKGGDNISIVLPKAVPNQQLIPENIPLQIVYEDDHVLVVNKPAGLVVHPAHGNWTGTLVNGLIYYFQNLPNYHGDLRPGIMHRIDKDTSGLLLIAKTEEAAYPLAKQFFNHSIERTYQAIIWGEPKNDEGTIANYIDRSKKDRKIMATYGEEESSGKWAVTHYKVIQRLKYVTLIECKLETGRTHQIRVHMKHIGHPIFNDAAYGGDKILKGVNTGSYKSFIHECFAVCSRQALHAKTLGFIHPVTQQHIQLDSSLPDDMQQLITKFANYLNELKN